MSTLKLSAKLQLFIGGVSCFILLVGMLAVYLHNTAMSNQNLIILVSSVFFFLATMISGTCFTKTGIRELKKIIDDLNKESSETAAASSQVQAASQELAEACIEESSSIQETSSTLEETSSMVQQNNENTQQAVLLAKKAAKCSENSMEEVQKMLDHMEKLKKSSDEIYRIAKVIDDISFQTNILSLNASVEAARVGDEGRGFAVVAGEIRNLAQRSDEAAKNTETIIKTNVRMCEEGLDLARDVETSLAEIDEESKKVSNLLDEIAIASNEQTKGIQEIHKAVAQMEQVVNINAHTADECASASRDLSEQADGVRDIVNELSTIVTGQACVTVRRPENKALVRPEETNAFKQMHQLSLESF